MPKCVGGTNEADNLVLLTAKEHFVCHQLLVKIYPNNHKLVFALRMMCRSTTRHIRNNREYEWIRKIISKSHSDDQKGKSYGFKFPKGHKLTAGENNGMYGKHHTTETRAKQSKKALDRPSEIYKGPKSSAHIQSIIKSRQTVKYKLISPEGTEIIFDRILDASNLSGVSIPTLIKLAGKRYKFSHCRNWRIYPIPL
jgi:hypothetical protein